MTPYILKMLELSVPICSEGCYFLDGSDVKRDFKRETFLFAYGWIFFNIYWPCSSIRNMNSRCPLLRNLRRKCRPAMIFKMDMAELAVVSKAVAEEAVRVAGRRQVQFELEPDDR